jgi:hypothetical protein
MKWMVACSISRSVQERLRQGRFEARVLAVFARACNLLAHDGAVLALVTPQVGDGPFNVVVDGAAGCFDALVPGAAVTLESERLSVGGLGVDLTTATPWEPLPDWGALRARRDAIASNLPLLRALCLHYAPANSFLALLDAPPRHDAILATAHKAVMALGRGWAGDFEQLQKGAVGLAGLGTGLTPSGDDFLCGAMLWAWLTHPALESFCHAIAQAAAPRTTTLSAAFLRAASRGECSAAWHALLAALGESAGEQITAAAQGVLAHGATSGADILAGFLWGSDFCSLVKVQEFVSDTVSARVADKQRLKKGAG